jgi:BlaI family penicillinase repressor
MAPRQIDLGAAELEVLKTLWDEAPLTVREVMNRLHGRGRQVAYTTVLTFLQRLEQKGFVKSDKSGMAYVYRPAVTRERVSKSRLSSLLDELYDGAAGPLVLQLIQEEEFTTDEIQQLHDLVERLDRATKKGRLKRKGAGG